MENDSGISRGASVTSARTLSGEMTGFDGVGKGNYIFGYGALPVSLTWARQGKREMATEHEGSAPEQPTTEPTDLLRIRSLE